MSWPERKEEWAACSLPPGPAVWRLASTGPYSPLGGHTKTSLNSMGVGHQREGKRGRAREEGSMARRQEGRRRRGGTERGRGKGHRLWHTCQPQRVGRGDCWGPSRLSPTDCNLPQTYPLRSEWILALDPCQPRVKGRGPDPQLTPQHLITWSANRLSSQAGASAARGTGRRPGHMQIHMTSQAGEERGRDHMGN